MKSIEAKMITHQMSEIETEKLDKCPSLFQILQKKNYL